MRKNRILAKSKLPSHVAHNTIKIYINYSENYLLYILWGDRNKVKIMTNIYILRTVTQKITRYGKEQIIKKPEAVLNYVRYTKGVDLCNQLSTEYRYEHFSKKWWKPIFYHILQVCIINSLIIYREIQLKKVSHKEFFESLILELLGEPKKKYKTKHHRPECIDPNQKGKGQG